MTIVDTVHTLDADEMVQMTARQVYDLLHRLLRGNWLHHLSREHLPALSQQYGELQDLIGKIRGEMVSDNCERTIVERELVGGANEIPVALEEELRLPCGE